LRLSEVYKLKTDLLLQGRIALNGFVGPPCLQWHCDRCSRAGKLMGEGHGICGTEPLHEAKIVDISKRFASSEGLCGLSSWCKNQKSQGRSRQTCSRASTPAVLKRFKLSIAMLNKT